jgi:hypothetical protein
MGNSATSSQIGQSWPATGQQRRAAFEAEIARCDAGFQSAKARGDEPAAFYWSLQRSAAVRLLPVAQVQGALL